MMTSPDRLCTACKHKETFFFRPYSGQKLCKKCFTESIEEKTRSTISRYGMFNFSDKIAVAVSGGKDSLSLLQILFKIEKKRPKTTLSAVTIDEGIEGYRDEALQIASVECGRLNIPHYVVSFRSLFGFTLDELVQHRNNGGDLRLTACTYCGILRRRALNVAARHVGATKIATGHTLDDEVQTLLMNIFRGDVVRLAKEKPITDKVHPNLIQRVKPLCEIPEYESALYAYLTHTEFQASPCPYASEALRNDFRTMLNQMEAKHAGTKFAISCSLERLRPALQTIASGHTYRACTNCGEPSSDGLCKVCEILKEMKR